MLSISSIPLHAKQLIRSTASMFFIAWERQFDKNGHSYEQLMIGNFITKCRRSCIVSRAEIFGETSNHPGDSVFLQLRFVTLQLLTLLQTKITFEREKISDHWWDSRKYNRAAFGNWQSSVRSWGAYWEGDWGVIVLSTMILVSCIFFSKYLYLS